MRSVLAVAVVAISACSWAGGLSPPAPPFAQEKAADKYESMEGKYAVAFPGTPKTTTNKTKDGQLNVAQVEKNGASFQVLYADLPAEAVKAANAKVILEGGEKGLVANLGVKVTASKEIEFGKQKYPAREFTAAANTMTFRVKLVLAGNRLYQVFVYGPKDVAEGKDADKFFESFEIK